MTKSLYYTILCLLCFSTSAVKGYIDRPLHTNAFDHGLYADVLDDEVCMAQLGYVGSDALLRTRFLDAGLRTPKSILMGNFVDLGSYYQCLAISHDSGDDIISGKYCSITIPLQQNLEWPTLPPEWPALINDSISMNEEMGVRLKEYETKRRAVRMLSGDDYRVAEGSIAAEISLTVAVCIPRPCSSQRAVNSLLNLTSAGITFTENFCRLPNDKPWVTADTIAAVVFSLLALLTIFSTCYDVIHIIVHKKDPKTINPLYQSFSVYTNAQRLVAYKSSPKTIECLDGIRVLAMVWIIVGHTYSTQLQTYLMNPMDALDWLNSPHSIWITAAPISVDTFFMLSGILLVYATAGKFSRMTFLKNIHLFYLNRLLRMFPILAAGVLLQASWFNRIADGPNWQSYVMNVHYCRTWWWTTLLHVQNYIPPGAICLGHSWYLAVDTQMHILSPLVLFWVFTSRRAAWLSITAALAAILTAATAFNAYKGFTFAVVNAGRLGDGNVDFMRQYYINTLTRGSPLVVGMLYGYLLVVARDKKIRLKKSTASLFWCLSLGTLSTVIYITYPTQLASWDSQALDVVFNSFVRPTWAAALGWLVFACANGYGGLINWMLSLQMWKLPSKLSYAMYIFHYPLILAMNATAVYPTYFSDSHMIFKFFADLTLAVLIAFLATLLIDAPFATLIRIALMGRGKKVEKVTTPSRNDTNGRPNTYSIDYESKTKL